MYVHREYLALRSTYYSTQNSKEQLDNWTSITVATAVRPPSRRNRAIVHTPQTIDLPKDKLGTERAA